VQVGRVRVALAHRGLADGQCLGEGVAQLVRDDVLGDPLLCLGEAAGEFYLEVPACTDAGSSKTSRSNSSVVTWSTMPDGRGGVMRPRRITDVSHHPQLP
jgi:hypothetical protein